MALAFNCQSSFITSTGVESIKAPAEKMFISALDVEQCRLFSGHKSYFKAVQRNGKPLTAGLDVGFFSCPAIKKGTHAFISRKGFQLRALFRREEACGDF